MKQNGKAIMKSGSLYKTSSQTADKETGKM